MRSTPAAIAIAGGAALWLAACDREPDRVPTQAMPAEQGLAPQPAETGGPATAPERRALERRAYDIQRGP